MKKLLFFATMLSMALFSCTSDDEGNVVGWKPGSEPVISSMLKANFNGGSMIVSSTGYLQSKGMLLSRAFSDYTDATSAPGSFAAEAAAVNAYEPTYTEAPSVPEGAIDLSDVNPYNGGLSIEAGRSYYIDKDFDVTSSIDRGPVVGDGTAYIYVKSGVKGYKLPATCTKATFIILEGAEVEATNSFRGLYNFGKVTLSNGLSQNTEYDAALNRIVSYDVFENYGELVVPSDKTIQVEGTFYTNKDLNVVLKGNGSLYVDANLVAAGSFGLQGKLYVKEEMSGDININGNNDSRLVAHVGSINTTGGVVVTLGAELMVEKDVKAASMKLDGSFTYWNGSANVTEVAECVIKGKAEITGEVDVASNTKGYIELLECENYKANASDIWVGCKSDVRQKFELNGNSKFTLANGVYVHAKNAVFASNTQMVMMDNAYFKVDEILQINNAGDNGFNGVGAKMAVVQADKIGANNEDFINTFTGNVGVVFNGWNYETSTDLIDNCTNLPRLGELQNSADHASIAKSDCNPGFTGSKVPTTPPAVEPVKTTYEVHYVVMDNGEYVDIATADTGIDANVGDNPKPGLTAKTVDGYTFSGQKNGPDALVEDAAQNKFYLIYNKNEESEQPTTPPATDPDPTPDPTPAINCGVTITLPVDIKGEWIAQADDFAIHNGDYLYENIAAGTVDVEDPNYVTDTGHNSIQNYVVVNAGERVTISIEDLCAMYEAYRGKTKICDDEKSVYFGKEVSYMDEEGIFTIETYIWPCKKTTESDGVNDIVKIYPVPASEYDVIADGVDGKYLVGGENTYETYLANNKYLVRAQAYQSYNGGGQGAAMTSYIKVTFHIQDITPKSAE